MPYAPTRPCPRPRCPNLQPCPVHPTGWRRLAGLSKADRGYGTAAWGPIRRRVLARDGGVCQVCGAPATHVDHVVPKHRGGTDDEAGLRAICAHCHAVKTGTERRR